MAYNLINKHKYPAYDIYSGVAQKSTFTLAVGPIVSTSSVVDSIVEQFEEQANQEGAVMLGVEIWEETSLLEKRYKGTAYLYDPLGRGQAISGTVGGVTLIIVTVTLVVLAILGVILAWLLRSAVTSIAEMDWAAGPVAVIRWGVYGIVAVGVIILGSILLKQRKRA